MRDLAARLPSLYQSRKAIRNENPDAFRAIGLRQLFEYLESLKNGGRIIPVPYVVEKKVEMNHALDHRHIVLLHGETGGGKTETCPVIARECTGKEPIILRGFPGMDSSRMFGHRTLRASTQTKPHELPDPIESEINQSDTKHPHQTSIQREQTHQQIIEGILSRSGVTVTQCVLGSVHQALSQGRALIIDDIPQPLIAKMNDILKVQLARMSLKINNSTICAAVRDLLVENED